MKPLRISTLALATAALLAGCGEKKDTIESPAATEATPEAPESAVSFISPKDGANVKGALICKVQLEDFTIDPKAVGQAPQPGRGHLHFRLDEGKYDYPKYSGPNGKQAVALKVDGKYSPALTTGITYNNLPKGKHTVEVYLANNNHTNVGPKARAEVVVR